MLLKRRNGAEINKINKNGETAYFYALTFANKRGIDILWEQGLSPFVKNSNGIDVIHDSILQKKAYLFENIIYEYIKKKRDKQR